MRILVLIILIIFLILARKKKYFTIKIKRLQVKKKVTKDKNLYLKRGTLIFYNSTRVPYSIYTFVHYKKMNIFKKKLFFDTIKIKL